MSTDAERSTAESAVYAVVPDASGVLVEARSNVGPIAFATTTLAGTATLAVPGGLETAVPLSAVVEIPVLSLESGNSLYDQELQTRLDHRRFPRITVELRAATPLGGGRFTAEGDVTIHGTTRRLGGTVAITVGTDDTLVAHGQELIDIRDFDIRVPTIRMLKIYPDVSVQFRVTAARI